MPAQPQDRKHKAVKQEAVAGDTFTWAAPDGREVRLTPFESLPTGLFRRVRGLTEMDATFDLIEAGTDKDGLAIIDDLPLRKLNDLFAAWQAGSGVDLPQS